ncbi:uncharacterized protein G2W53_033937 [Senna tora]|uniref:Uncharacterized protein n=1 Tax=Senna tora TaxID=362788 RepID=A0A834WBF8_9FABA|nr:uncharacterized protein G2W53_033937 [Senna tora]
MTASLSNAPEGAHARKGALGVAIVFCLGKLGKGSSQNNMEKRTKKVKRREFQRRASEELIN